MENAELLNDGFFNCDPPLPQTKVHDPEHEVRCEHKKTFFAMIQTFQKICVELKAGKQVDGNEMKAEIDTLISCYKKDERMLLGLANTPYTYILRNMNEPVYNYIVIHGINIMIYSLKLSIDLDIPNIRLPYICIAALFHHFVTKGE